MKQDGPTQRIGIFGGTFNPIHLGHLILAQTALETFELSKVLFIPCGQPPHKDAATLLDGTHRRAMVEAAIQDNPFFELCDIDLERSGRSYAIDTVSSLKQSHPEADLLFIIGSDTLKELHAWKDIYSLLRLCGFISFSRPQHPAEEIRAADLHLDPPWPERLLANVSKGRLIDISSTDIRYRVAEGLSIRYIVPALVEMYIGEHGLYGSVR